jgi:exopolysaccharide production protein ExoQ
MQLGDRRECPSNRGATGDGRMKGLERFFHIVAFMLQCGAIVPLLLRSDDQTSDLGAANPLNTLATAFVLAVTLLLMVRHGRPALRYAPGMWPILSLAVLALLSIAWSDYPDITLRRAGSLLTAGLWAWYVTSCCELAELVSIIRQACLLLALASLAIGVAAPDLGQEDAVGTPGWRGIFATKNDLGMAAALGTVTFFYCLLAGRPRLAALLRLGAGLALCTAALYLAQSRTCWLIAALGMLLCLAVKLTHRRVGVAIIIWTTLLLLLAPTVAIVTDELAAIAPLLGRDSQLSGRVDLWLILTPYINERPWLGHGFGAFWVADSVNVSLIWSAVGWTPPHAHNGWLDLLLELGIAGAALLATQLLMLLVNGIRAVIEGHEPHAQYILVMVFLILVYNLSESNLLRPGALWVLLVVAATALSRIAQQRTGTTKPVILRPRPPPHSPARPNLPQPQ